MARKSRTGSFLQITLAAGYHAYARKLPGLSTYGIYDLVTTSPLQDIARVAAASVCLIVGLDTHPDWPKIGAAALESTWPAIWRFWTAESLPVPLHDSQHSIVKSETEYFLVEEWTDELTKVAHSRKTRATIEALRGLPRWSLYTPDFIEDKLRDHFGLTKTGKRIPPRPLPIQLPW